MHTGLLNEIQLRKCRWKKNLFLENIKKKELVDKIIVPIGRKFGM